MKWYDQVVDLMVWYRDPEAFGCIAFEGWRCDLDTGQQQGRYAVVLGVDVMPF